jgi:hypothetical protein
VWGVSRAPSSAKASNVRRCAALSRRCVCAMSLLPFRCLVPQRPGMYSLLLRPPVAFPRSSATWLAH